MVRTKQSDYAFATLSNKEMVNRYFKLISDKDVHRLLELFEEDAIVYEPFSKLNRLEGKSRIENFLKVAFMANAGLRRTIRFVDESRDSISAIVTFERGDSVTGKFAFTFKTRVDDLGNAISKKIAMLKIEFIEDY